MYLNVIALNPQTTVRAQHFDSCKSETENYLEEIFQVILNGSKYYQIIAQLPSGSLLHDLESRLAIDTF